MLPAVKKINGGVRLLQRVAIGVPLALVAVVAMSACTPAEKVDAQPQAAASTAVSSPAAAPTSEAPQGRSKNVVCSSVSVDLADGSVEIADNAVKSIDERWSEKKVGTELKKSFGKMAVKVKAEAADVSDPVLKAAVEKVAADLVKGSKSADPNRFLQKDFQTLTKSLDKACGL